MKPVLRAPALALWHRRAGLAAGLLVVVLALSGVALNHTTALGLDRRQIATPWLMRWLGLPPDEAGQVYAAGAHRVMGRDNRIFLDGAMLPHAADGVAGAVAVDRTLIVAGPAELLLLTDDGALIERITALPAPILKIGLTPAGRVALGAAGDRVFTSDTDMLEWRQTGEKEIMWSLPGSPPAGISGQYSDSPHGLSLERVVLEVHSGRIMGKYGPWLMDGAAILLVMLAATGVLGWFRTRNGNGANDAP